MNATPLDITDVNHQFAAMLAQGRSLHQQGRLADARTIYNHVLAREPKNFDALNLLGVIAAGERDYELAAQLMGKAVAIRPNEAMLHFNLGLVLRGLKRLDEAVASFQRTIAAHPDFDQAHFNLGLCLQGLGRSAEALTSFQRTIGIKPDFVAAHIACGITLLEVERPQDALVRFDSAIALSPEQAVAHFYCGNTLFELKRMHEAAVSYSRAIAIQPNDANALFNCGNALKELQRFKDAIDHYDGAIAIQPVHADAHCNRGLALHELNRNAEAICSYDRAIELNPGDADAHFNRGISLAALGHIEDSLVSYETAIAISPTFAEPHWNKSLLLLSQAKFEQGWQLYEWRWKTRGGINRGASQRNVHSLWLGHESLAGKTILLHAEQGLGDTIQFCRYAKLVKGLGATVLLEVPKPLVGLLSNLEGVDQVIEQGSALPAFDYHCPLMSLPLAFKTRLDTIPSSQRYLHAQPTKVAQWQQRLGPALRPRVGLVWSGGFRPDQPELWALNKRRNLPLDQLKVLKGLDLDFISLQKGEPAESEFAAEQQAGWDGPAIANYSADLQDFSDTAALIETLDLVVSVDTSVAHLAAALGKPVWILNRFGSCWRWLQDRTDSPWYPTVRLYNQRSAADWEEVMHRVRQDLIARSG
jgi:tetratricopeptide (TPR) repeat protein